MERLNWHMADLLGRRWDVRVIGPAGSRELAPASTVLEEAAAGPLWRFLVSTCLKAVRCARSWRPQIVLAGSGLTAPFAWLAARLCGARAVAYVHGLDLTVPHVVYQAIWVRLLRRMDLVIANSQATAALAVHAGLQRSRLRVVNPGVTLPEGGVDALTRVKMRGRFGGVDGPILLSVGRWTRRKGLLEFVDRILPLVVADQPDLRLVVVGEAPRDALHASTQTRDEILAVAQSRGVAGNIHFAGKLTDDELQAMYAAADVHVFPVRPVPDDPEGFGMVAIEAAAHGLPTVAFAVGGVVDAVSNGVSGMLVPENDDARFAAAVLQLLAQPLPQDAIHRHAEAFCWERFADQLEEAVAQFCDGSE